MPQTLIKKNCDQNSQFVEGWWVKQRVPKMKMLMLSLEHLCKRNLQISETFIISVRATIPTSQKSCDFWQNTESGTELVCIKLSSPLLLFSHTMKCWMPLRKMSEKYVDSPGKIWDAVNVEKVSYKTTITGKSYF